MRAVPIEWHRGPAWVDGDDIVMDLARSTPYWPLAEPGVGVELSRVRAPDDAAAFVERFGMLRATRERRLLEFRRPASPCALLREAFAHFQATAEDLQGILEAAVVVRRATSGDAEAMNQLRAWFVVAEDEKISVRDSTTGDLVRRAGDALSPDERLVGADDRTVLLHASQDTARRLNDGLALDEATPCVFDRAFVGEAGIAPGTWCLGMIPSTLAGVCYLSVALALADRREIGACEEATCRRMFFGSDSRQRFCTPACAGRARQRRFKAKRSEGG